MVNSTRHMFNIQKEERMIQIADGKVIKPQGVGSLHAPSREDGNILKLEGVLFVPQLDCPLLSISSLNRSGVTTVFAHNKKRFEKNRMKIVDGVLRGKLYYLDLEIIPELNSRKVSYDIWHCRLAHPSEKKMKENLTIHGEIKVEGDNKTCESWIVSKFKRKPVKPTKQNYDLLEVVASDLIGPFKVLSIGGARYLQTIVDHGSNLISLYLLATKEAETVSQNIIKYVNFGQNQYRKCIKTLITDGQSEFKSLKLMKFLEEKGIKHVITLAETPQTNGVCER
jgi:GAG-pre-integrase domain